MVSSPERAILEFINELPDNESFHQADMLMEGLSTLSPGRMQTLLNDMPVKIVLNDNSGMLGAARYTLIQKAFRG
jgi:hypothetical protein